MSGPLARIGTITEGITLDVNRTLYMGQGKTMTFLVPDTTQVDNWRTLIVISKGFDEVSGREKDRKDGSEKIFKVADPTNVLGPIFRTKDLYVEVDSVIYSVATVPQISANQAQVFTLTCKIRTLRNKFFDNGKK